MLSASSIFISTYYVSYERDIRNTLTDVKIFNEYLMTIKWQSFDWSFLPCPRTDTMAHPAVIDGLEQITALGCYSLLLPSRSLTNNIGWVVFCCCSVFCVCCCHQMLMYLLRAVRSLYANLILANCQFLLNLFTFH